MVPEAEIQGEEEAERGTSQEAKRPRLATAEEAVEDVDYLVQLGKSAKATADRLREVGFSSLVEEIRGRSNLAETVGSIDHPAAGLLDELRMTGAPVEFSCRELTAEERDAAMEYGSHGSCVRGLEFIGKEMMDFVRKGFYMVLPYECVKDVDHLHLSPMGLVPQRDRRDRIVVDYSYYGLNDATVPLAADSMQFGRALQRVLQRIYDADPKHGPVYLMKVDVADGFYRVWLRIRDVPKLAIALPPIPGQPKLVAFPLVLPMGWTESPPHFCTLTETVADLANKAIVTNAPDQPHRLERLADTSPAPIQAKPPTLDVNHNRRGRHQRPLAYIDVFVDDFLGVAQGSAARRNRVRRLLLQSFDEVFRELEEGEEPRQEPVSVKKLLKGDASWAVAKILLGWLVDSVRGTIELPPHREERLVQLIGTFLERKRTSLKKWRQLIGELRSMTVALPGSEGLFSNMQSALTKALQSGSRVRIGRHEKAELSDWAWLADSLCTRPTSIAEVVHKQPAFGGDCDAAKPGMGGVLFNLRSPTAAPILWRHPFPDHVQRRVVSFDNPGGDINNSQLELAGALAQHDIAAQAWDVRHCTIATRNDNSATVAWSLKGSVSRNDPVAYLLRLFSLHRREFRYTTTIAHLAGDLNRMADDCSRLWHLTDSQLLTYFNSKYPQRKPWRMCRLRSAMSSAVISALSSKRSSPGSWTPKTKQTTESGTRSGAPSAPPSTSTNTSPPSTIPSPSFKYSSVGSATAASPYTELRSAHVLLRNTSARLDRRSPDWVSPTLASTTRASSTSASKGN